MSGGGKIKLFAGNSNLSLAKEIAELLKEQ
jgi:hypothetical protein